VRIGLALRPLNDTCHNYSKLATGNCSLLEGKESFILALQNWKAPWPVGNAGGPWPRRGVLSLVLYRV
jgi:hypothetical protein